ncbi:MAG: SAM-dependent methyltransferase [Chitinimonas sp.]|nr:SAM-dependent methyltransferase [Chitinimonas sp.]
MPTAHLGYQVKFESVSINGTSDLEIRSLLDRQQYADPLGEAERAGISPASWPLFGMVWPSARMLAATMALRQVDGRRILELGCGLALASLVSHRRGADVIASDVHPLTETFLLENLRLNALPPMVYRTGDWHGSDASLGQFDLIIGSDVLYERDQPAWLSSFIDRHSNDGVEVLIVDPKRGNHGHFNRLMAERGYDCSDISMDGAQASGEAYRGRMLRYLRA